MSNYIEKGTHIMVDLETMGVKATSVLLSIGAVKFDETGIKEAFYCRFDQSQAKYSRTVDSSTVNWWLTQPEAARIEAFGGTTDLAEGLAEFNLWAVGVQFIWGNGSAFDVAMLRNSLAATDVCEDFLPFGDRCYRTIKSIPANKGIKMMRVGMYHKAVDDARSQAAHLLAMNHGSYENADRHIRHHPRNKNMLEVEEGWNATAPEGVEIIWHPVYNAVQTISYGIVEITPNPREPYVNIT
jgi:hypothetical protein